jgi:hypothetical protein
MSLNPLIKLGELHNEILDYVISQSPTNPPEITQMANIISDYYAANYAPTNNLTEKNKCYSLLMNYYNEFYGLTKSQLIAIANSRNGANPFARKFIDNVFIDYSGYNLDSLIIYLNGLLDDIIINSDVTNQMKQLPFFSTSIGLKSAEYWKFQFQNQTNWYPFISARPIGASLADLTMTLLIWVATIEMENKGIEPANGDIILMVFAVSLASSMGSAFLDQV